MQEDGLVVRNLTVSRGGAPIVRDVSFAVPAGGVLGLLGANGAGKSTLVDGVCGFARRISGEISYGGVDISRLKPEAMARRGIIQVSQERDLFPNLTVQENLELGSVARSHRETGSIHSVEEAYELFPRLAERRRSKAGSLSGGEQQMLAIGRALIGAPQVLLLDEPMSGLAPVIVQEVEAVLEKLLRDKSFSVLLVEQNIDVVLRNAEQIVVLRSGDVAFQGHRSELGEDPRIRLAELYV